MSPDSEASDYAVLPMESWDLELEEWELIGFFGQDADPLDKEEAEFFGSSSFTMKLEDGDVVEFTVQRNFRAVYVTLSNRANGPGLQVRGIARSAWASVRE